MEYDPPSSLTDDSSAKDASDLSNAPPIPLQDKSGVAQSPHKNASDVSNAPPIPIQDDSGVARLIDKNASNLSNAPARPIQDDYGVAQLRDKNTSSSRNAFTLQVNDDIGVARSGAKNASDLINVPPSQLKDDSGVARLPAKTPSDLRKALDKCGLCGKTLSLQSARKSNNVFKITKCCSVFGCVHIKCAKRVSTLLNGSYKFDQYTYGDENSVSLYCFVCKTKCFVCGKNHQLPPGNKDQDVSVRSCLSCNKWCYITKKCNADKSIKHCHECKFKIDTNEVISNESPIHSAISPITNQCDSSKQVRIHKALTQLLKGLIQDTELTLLDYKDLLTLRLTHLHPTEHNIFSMNHPTNDPVNGLFLSAKSVMLLAEPESKFMVTEEMINFFVDCFNFYG